MAQFRKMREIVERFDEPERRRRAALRCLRRARIDPALRDHSCFVHRVAAYQRAQSRLVEHRSRSMKLDGKIAIITGGGQGSGGRRRCGSRATAPSIVVADWNEDGAKETVSLVEAGREKAAAVKVDVTKLGGPGEDVRVRGEDVRRLRHPLQQRRA